MNKRLKELKSILFIYSEFHPGITQKHKNSVPYFFYFQNTLRIRFSTGMISKIIL